jgi:predicted GIY-YIG superfamily endonuclease
MVGDGLWWLCLYGLEKLANYGNHHKVECLQLISYILTDNMTHYCYILYNTCNNKSYVGYTTNPTRRLRQHNGDIHGGARYTHRQKESQKGGKWEHLVVITSSHFTKHIALSLEWHVKRGKWGHGPMGRLTNLLHLLQHHSKFVDHDCELYLSPCVQNNAPLSIINELVDMHGRLTFHDNLMDI